MDQNRTMDVTNSTRNKLMSFFVLRLTLSIYPSSWRRLSIRTSTLGRPLVQYSGDGAVVGKANSLHRTQPIYEL
jgi:hypothetical protein